MFSYDFKLKFNDIFDENSHPTLSRLCHNFNNPGWNYHYHLHKNETEIVYIASGKAEYTIDMEKFSLEKGQLLIMEKGVLHSITSDEEDPVDAWTYVIKDYKIKEINEETRLLSSKTYHIMPTGIHEDFIKNTFEQMYNFCLKEDPISFATCSMLSTSLTSVIYNLLPKEEESKDDKTSSFIRDVLVYISEHYTESITLKELSEIFHVSAGHISHSFTKEYGVSPINYAINLRMCDAKLLLINSNDSLVSIAKKVGYHNPTHFTNIFTKRMNCSPTEYREIHLKKRKTSSSQKVACINTEEAQENIMQLQELKKDLEKMKEENQILQKAMAILAAQN